MKLQISDLIIEVTRRCNLSCEHCLRGEPQNLSMKEEYLRNLLSQVSYISTVTFSGGEPTLPSGMKAIDMFIDLCYEYNVSVGSFYIVTNGKKWRTDFPRLIWRLHNLCDDNEVSGIDVSGDQFHWEVEEYKRKVFTYTLEEGLEEEGLTVDDVYIGIRGEIDYKAVITEGRGEDFGGRKNSDGISNLIIDTYDYDDESTLVVQEGNIYLNCKGNIVVGCDWSYKSQDKEENILCHSSEDILETVKSKGKTEEEFWEEEAA